MPNLKFNSSLSKKKLLMLGFLFSILLIIPLTVYLVQQQQETRSQATPNTTLSFSPPSKTAAVGDQISFDIILSPGNNQVSSVKLAIKYDSTKLSATEASFEVDPASGLSILQGPVVANGLLSVVLSIGSDPTKVIQNDTKIGTVTFDVIGTSDLPTEISFDPNGIKINSISGQNADAFNENVFLNGVPASVTIQSGDGIEPTPTATPAATPILTPAPTSTPSGNDVTPSTNQSPVCSSLDIDVSATGAAPHTVTFTASGTDSDGTISKVAFNFGEGTVEEVASGSGITTDSVDVSVSHTYENVGVFTASAVLTDDDSGTSDSVSCARTITVTDDGSTTSDDTDDTDETAGTSVTPSPFPATGPTSAIVGAGMLGGILLMIGMLLFFAL